jgi:FkbH-like protein
MIKDKTVGIFSNYISEIIKRKLFKKSQKTIIKNFNFDSFSSNFLNTLKKQSFDKLFLISDLEISFTSFFSCLENNNENLNSINREIKIISELMKLAAKQANTLYVFLYPIDTSDSFFGSLDNKVYGKNWLINYINLNLSKNLSRYENIFLIDTNKMLLKNFSLENIFDYKSKYLIGSSYSLEFINKISEEINNLINAKKKIKIKLVILDLDNTIWGGEAGERSFDKLELGPTTVSGKIFYDFQRRLKILKKKGILLSICSKNDFLNVKKVFNKNPHMILSMNDFSAIKINWKNKNENVEEILRELNLRPENVIFIDDSLYERNIVKKNIKKIKIFDFPNNLLELNYKFNNLSGFEKNIVTVTDKKRTRLYTDESKRLSLKKNTFNQDDWIKKLKIKVNFRRLANFDRAEEMFQRTNQFNISHKCKNKKELLELDKKKDHLMYEVSMQDKFGDYGFVSLVILHFDDNSYYITDFLQSCRVFERHLDEVIFFYLKNQKILKNKLCFLKINRNNKNQYVQNLFDKSNFLTKVNSRLFKLNENYNFINLKNKQYKING